MLEVQNLSYSTKTFSMENVSFSLDDGYLMTLLGRNGAGKTTLFDLVYGRIEPLSGKVLWNDIDVTGMKAIFFGSTTQIVSHFDEMLEMMEFTKEEYTTKFEELSTGKQMQLQLAFALARHPKLLLLDEPMANLDPVVKTDIWELLIRTIEKENISIIISTHLVEEVNDITDYIGLLDNGRLVKFGDREQILNDDLGNKNKNLRELLEEENG